MLSRLQELIAALPEEWRPGPTFHGIPWEPVMVTAAVGFLTVLMFFWRTLLAIKGRTYQLTEKQLKEKIQQLLSEKSDAAEKISKLNEVIKEREEQFKNSEKNLGSSQRSLQQKLGKCTILMTPTQLLVASVKCVSSQLWVDGAVFTWQTE